MTGEEIGLAVFRGLPSYERWLSPFALHKELASVVTKRGSYGSKGNCPLPQSPRSEMGFRVGSLGSGYQAIWMCPEDTGVRKCPDPILPRAL